MSESIKLANEIIKLDQQRDKIWEELLLSAGDRAFEILRELQNTH
ncbi:hypothetical protein [Sutcliffiella rhizosphaerae]|uniref:Uncharacterized protein n=1 Tax=Sutcliffiella rhizosphaerae TaxID=2880967 RepID=A0ABM8YPM8_9BACI|nr:hypothetical protein [Sutcliffiella rhizosphaerae]CAG9621974.1 hypothetical protein BACCIP111883_02765 [Sutcliffiella rhizosphaerae]